MLSSERCVTYLILNLSVRVADTILIFQNGRGSEEENKVEKNNLPQSIENLDIIEMQFTNSEGIDIIQPAIGIWVDRNLSKFQPIIQFANWDSVGRFIHHLVVRYGEYKNSCRKEVDEAIEGFVQILQESSDSKSDCKTMKEE